MEHLFIIHRAVSIFLFIVILNAWAGEGRAEQPWQKLYTGEEARGENVIALWQFLPGQESKDNSGHGHDLTLRGQTRFVKEGLFGSCLESFPADREHDKPQGAVVKNHPSLTPLGAFTLEMWIKPKPEIDKYATVFLLDKKYYHYPKDIPQANWDYCLYLTRRGENRYRIVAYLGYGKDSAAYTSKEVLIRPNEWVHIAFTYDGAGTGRFYLNGKSVGQTTHEGRGSVTPGNYDLVIGDRYGSIHAGFPGYIDQVRISKGVVPFFSGTLEVEVSEGTRTAFLRMEKGAYVPFAITNGTGTPLKKATALVTFGSTKRKFALPNLSLKETCTIKVPVDTTLCPDSYPLKVLVTAAATDKQHQVKETFSVTIVPRPLPHTMPVVMWGLVDTRSLKEIGFTHGLVSFVDYGKVWKAGKPTDAVDVSEIQEKARMLDEYLAQGLGAVVCLDPGPWVMRNRELKEKYQRIDRSGQPYKHENVCALFPEIQAFAYNVGASVAKTFGHFPSLQAGRVHTEVRDNTNLCFHEHDKDAFRKFAGYNIPKEIVSKWGIHYEKLEDFPKNRIVPDDHPILTFYRWFWKWGDGWNDLHTHVHRGLKSTGRDDLWTFFDPAVRVPSIWGSGGGVDVISQWTYSYPDPIKIGQATDEMFAMAEGAPHYQKVMKMTQIIWYRSGTAPELPKDESKRAQWEREIPDARFITIAPDHLREAFWAKISRPVRGIMYHGWESLVKASGGIYSYTNPESKEVLAELIRQVVRPLGPTLLQVPDRRSDVALLESFTSQVFAGRGTWGWSYRWEADLHLVLQWAQIQPRIIYEETVLRDGLDDIRVLFMPCCDVLTESVARKIAEFQRKGGIIVADEHLTPAIRPNILITSYQRTGKADEDKAVLQAKAAELRHKLDPLYNRYADSSNPDVVTRLRRYRNADYLFAVNDKRTFGTYVGHHGKVMEKGLPTAATLFVRRKSGFVYDLLAHKSIPVTMMSEGLTFEANFGAGDGRLFMITEERIVDVRIQAPVRARRGQRVNLRIAVVDAKGKPIAAVVPVELEIIDPKGRVAEFSGYYGAKDGALAIALDLAPNDATGKWTIRIKELALGLTREHRLVVSQ